MNADESIWFRTVANCQNDVNKPLQGGEGGTPALYCKPFFSGAVGLQYFGHRVSTNARTVTLHSSPRLLGLRADQPYQTSQIGADQPQTSQVDGLVEEVDTLEIARKSSMFLEVSCQLHPGMPPGRGSLRHKAVLSQMQRQRLAAVHAVLQSCATNTTTTTTTTAGG